MDLTAPHRGGSKSDIGEHKNIHLRCTQVMKTNATSLRVYDRYYVRDVMAGVVVVVLSLACLVSKTS